MMNSCAFDSSKYNKIYVCLIGVCYFYSVERYSTEMNTWTKVAEMNARRSGAGVGVVDNVLYAIGGHDGPLVRKSCEKYNVETDTWTMIAGQCFK